MKWVPPERNPIINSRIEKKNLTFSKQEYFYNSTGTGKCLPALGSRSVFDAFVRAGFLLSWGALYDRVK